jgi:SAM-dependent methyltransferase
MATQPERLFGGPFSPEVPVVRQFAAVLRDVGYVSETLLKVGILSASGTATLPFHELLNRCQGDIPLVILFRLFALGQAEPARDVAAALAQINIVDLIEAGILVAAGDRVRASAAIMPLGELYICRDFSSSMTGLPPRDDQVLPVGGASVLTDALAVRSPGQLVLDLGCGQGVHMLAARRHASRVIGTDINPRALNFSCMNGMLNQPLDDAKVAPCEVREGSFFEPVEEYRNRFDLIISNPPFVLTPDSDRVGFTSGLRGDDTTKVLLSQAPDYLSEGGWFVAPTCWYHHDPYDVYTRPRSWIEGRGCDVFIARVRTYHPRDYAWKWAKECNPETEPTENELDRWAAMFESLDAYVVTFGFIVARKRNGRNWIATDTVDYDTNNGPAGEQFKRMFEGRTMLHERASNPASILDVPMFASDAVRIAEESTLTTAGWRSDRVVFSTTPGIAWPFRGDRVVAALLAALATGGPPRQHIAKLCRDFKLDPQAGTNEVLALVRTMLERGMLSPGRPPRPSHPDAQ